MILAFLAGLALGGNIGVLVAALAFAAKEEE